MKDTPRHISDIQKKIILSKTNEERSLMGAEMIDSVYQMIRDRIIEEKPGLSKREINAEMFLRYYQNEFSEQEKEKIIASIKSG
ncbi:hypothetical protein [Gracilimonas sp.]|uniref:hypothetical protein n=1 Tax=Gracilimonas sp. TaxID=1974203 RepID=UPI0032EED03D